MSEFVEEDSKLKARAVVKLRRENTNMLVSLSYVQYLNNTDKTNCAICFVNYQLRGREGTVGITVLRTIKTTCVRTDTCVLNI